MAKTIKKLLLMFAYGVMLIFGAMFAVWASWKTIEFTSGDGKLTAENGDILTSSKRNEMISRARGIFTDSNGNVGIGTENPTEKLVVDGNIKAGTGTNSGTVIHLPCNTKTGLTYVNCDSDEIITGGGAYCPLYYVLIRSYPHNNGWHGRCTKYNARTGTDPNVYAICCKK